ncbi:hypothetical protein C5167_028826 [Papaver somniferum]|nr:hypothetical protein C5167_028826 [Papaver somniferum]
MQKISASFLCPEHELGYFSSLRNRSSVSKRHFSYCSCSDSYINYNNSARGSNSASQVHLNSNFYTVSSSLSLSVQQRLIQYDDATAAAQIHTTAMAQLLAVTQQHRFISAGASKRF